MLVLKNTQIPKFTQEQWVTVLFWVSIHDAQEGLHNKNISDLVRKDIYGIFEIKNPIKDQIRRYKRPGEEWFSIDVYTYVCSDLMSRTIKNC